MAYLFELLLCNSRNSRIESRHTLRDKISRHLVDAGLVALLAFEVREVEASHAVGLELDEAWR